MNEMQVRETAIDALFRIEIERPSGLSVTAAKDYVAQETHYDVNIPAGVEGLEGVRLTATELTDVFMSRRSDTADRQVIRVLVRLWLKYPASRDIYEIGQRLAAEADYLFTLPAVDDELLRQVRIVDTDFEAVAYRELG